MPLEPPPAALPSRFHLITPRGVEVEAQSGFADDVRLGLSSNPKRLPCHWFYDAVGSEIFEEICELPEYYLTRCERSILDKHADEIAARFEAPVTLVELGSGSASKTRLLIEAFSKRSESLVFAPIDISRSALEGSARPLLDDFPDLEIQAFAGRYESGLEYLRRHGRSSSSTRLTLWLGSSVGNLGRAEAARFLADLRARMSDEDRLLIGIDLRKGRHVLESAYDDSRGVTARFNLNLLARINRELGGGFDIPAFGFRATYRADSGRVESHLVSRADQSVPIEALDVEIDFSEGETIHTENSYKYSPSEIEWLAGESDMRCEHRWFDADGLYTVNLFAPA